MVILSTGWVLDEFLGSKKGQKPGFCFIAPLLNDIEVSNVLGAIRKSWARDVMNQSDLTPDPLFKVKLGS